MTAGTDRRAVDPQERAGRGLVLGLPVGVAVAGDDDDARSVGDPTVGENVAGRARDDAGAVFHLRLGLGRLCDAGDAETA